MSHSCSLFPRSPFQIPEYCQTLDEEAVLENSFDLIFAFDEIVALGYRESVNLAQIRTFTGAHREFALGIERCSHPCC